MRFPSLNKDYCIVANRIGALSISCTVMNYVIRPDSEGAGFQRVLTYHRHSVCLL